MDAFDQLSDAAGSLFASVNDAANDAAFSPAERNDLNMLLADPLAADHLLLAEATVRGKGDGAMNAVTTELGSARAGMDAVLAGNNNAAARSAAIGTLHGACDSLTDLMR